MILALGRLYRVVPRRKRVRRPWVNPGAVAATALWLGVSFAFSAYVTEIGSYDVIYGSLSAAIALLIWIYLTGLAILLGAEFDALTERRRAGPPAGSLSPYQ